MFDWHHFVLFFAAAFLLAVTPGPGIFYVLARSLAGGKREGIQSSLGTFVGGLFHVVAAALGISAILAASARLAAAFFSASAMRISRVSFASTLSAWPIAVP